MSSPVFDRRRSERFAELLDEAVGRRRHHRRTDLDGELATLVRTAGRAGELTRAPEPDSEFRTGLRSMLLATIDREGIGVTAQEKAAKAAAREAMAGKTQVVQQVQPAGTGRTRAAVLIGVTAGALALSGVSAASTDSLPGDALYQVKRSSERAQLALAGSDLSRGQLHLDFAVSRLVEASKVDAKRVREVLDAMDGETVSGVYLLAHATIDRREDAALQALRGFVDDQRRGLAALQRLNPTADVAGSLTLLAEVEKRVQDLAVALANACVVTAGDRLGPRPDESCLR